MAAYIDLFALLEDETMQKRVRFALFVAARQARGAAQASVATKSWADKVFKDAIETPFRYIMVLVVSSPAVNVAGANVLDTDLQQIVNQLIPTLVSGEIT